MVVRVRDCNFNLIIALLMHYWYKFDWYLSSKQHHCWMSVLAAWSVFNWIGDLSVEWMEWIQLNLNRTTKKYWTKIVAKQYSIPSQFNPSSHRVSVLFCVHGNYLENFQVAQSLKGIKAYVLIELRCLAMALAFWRVTIILIEITITPNRH